MKMNEYLFKIGLFSLVAFGLFSCVTTDNVNTANILSTDSDTNSSSNEVRSYNDDGIEIVSVSLTAKDYMLNLRYKVIDAEKAKPILNRKNKPYLISEKDGNRLHVPNTAKLGALRQSTQKPELNRIYYVLFKNYSKLLKPGDKVTIVIGDFRAENITII